MNKASEEIKGYRSVIKKDFDVLENKLHNIEEKIDKLSAKLDRHTVSYTHLTLPTTMLV